MLAATSETCFAMTYFELPKAIAAPKDRSAQSRRGDDRICPGSPEDLQ